ncbi:MAG: ADP-ribose pyrophosphatase YjhB (NUDIX family) [Shewanella psychromarinicola]|jgi:ADP-ribose pyrophosphatase YjhB (NUDIX family)|uniref:NUDIX hydrolase n=1 Tax=Shewanella psychromarinicola TaxID=2487742 RepID=UPI003ABFF4E1
MEPRWKPNVTVATVVERTSQQNNKEYLFVHEVRDGKKVYNQPAGHLDEGESLAEAAIRETREETGWDVTLTHLVGIYRFIGENGITYIRHVFAASPIQHNPTQALDDGIIEAVWMTYEDIVNNTNATRSAMVKSALDDFRKGDVYPLGLLHEPKMNINQIST